MADLLALSKRCDEIGVANRELDLEIETAINPNGDVARIIRETRRGLDGKDGLAWELSTNCILYENHSSGRCFSNGGYSVPAYTESVDAALTLFPKGLDWVELNLMWDTIGCWPSASVRWYPPGRSGKNWHGCVSKGATMALALCSAALEIRAREAALLVSSTVQASAEPSK